MGLFDAVGKLFGGGDDQSKGAERALNEIRDLNIPGAENFYIELERMVDLGELDPELAEAIFMEQTGLQDIEVDPRLREAQYATLDRLDELANAEGLDAQAMARLREARAMEDQRLQGDLGAIEQQAARQMGGVGMSGMAQANKLLAAQQSANRMADGGFQAAAEAERRALEALQQRAGLSGQMEGRQFAQDEAKARAADMINQFNTQQATRTQEQNVAAMNQAQRENLARQMQIQEFNLGRQAMEEQARVGADRTEFEDERRKAETLAGAFQDLGSARAGERRDNASAVGNLASTAATVFSMFSDEKMKENVEPIDVDEFLGNITGYKYDYKEGPDDMYGVMAQDAPADMVGEVGGNKTVNIGPEHVHGMLAALENIHTRLKDLED